jgi:hypothetical protein
VKVTVEEGERRQKRKLEQVQREEKKGLGSEEKEAADNIWCHGRGISRLPGLNMTLGFRRQLLSEY